MYQNVIYKFEKKANCQHQTNYLSRHFDQCFASPELCGKRSYVVLTLNRQ